MAIFGNSKKVDTGMLEVLKMVANDVKTLSQRYLTASHGLSHSDNRDLYEVYGYKQTRFFTDYYEVYRLQDIANRIVNSVARSCWRDGLRIVVDEEEQLTDEMYTLINKCKMLAKIEQADVLNRIGRFSVLYVGLPDGNQVGTPVGIARPEDLDKVYFSPFAEDGVVVSEWDQDPASPRYGMPKLYTLQPQLRADKEKERIGQPVTVHHSRVIHLAEGALDGSLEGISALEPVLNRLVDLNKTIGGASEAYFRNARGKYALEAERGFTSHLSDEAKADLEDEVIAFTNNWKDAMRLSGVQAKVLTTPHADPVGTVRVALEAIAGATGIPMRILTGEGAGQLAGNEDKESYNQLVGDRQLQVCTPWIVEILELLESVNMVELPEQYKIEWPVASALNEKDKSQVHMQNAKAMSDAATALNSPAFAHIDTDDVIRKMFDMEFKTLDTPREVVVESTEPEQDNSDDGIAQSAG